jgi:saccharopine dehydrogenase-like NADP-dependent oxidoreductase
VGGRGSAALVGIGVEPGLSDVFARYAADHLFSEIDELGTRDGANLVVTDDDGNEIFAPSFSMWTTIEECLNPPVVWQDGEWHTTPPFSEPEVFDFPEGIGPVECVNVEHEEVLLMPRWVDCKRATFKYGLGDEFINILKVLNTLGLDRTEKVRVKGVESQPTRRGRRRAARPGDRRPADEGQDLRRSLGHRQGQGRAAEVDVPLPRRSTTRLTMAEYGHQCVVWQTAINPVVALELLAPGTWSGAGVLGPEAFDAVPFLDLLTEYGSPVGPAGAGDSLERRRTSSRDLRGAATASWPSAWKRSSVSRSLGPHTLTTRDGTAGGVETGAETPQAELSNSPGTRHTRVRGQRQLLLELGERGDGRRGVRGQSLRRGQPRSSGRRAGGSRPGAPSRRRRVHGDLAALPAGRHDAPATASAT